MGSRSTGWTHSTIGGGASTPPSCVESSAPSHETRTTADLVLAFAKAIAEPDSPALLVDRNNKNDGWTSLEEAVARGRAFAIQVQDTVLALDADRPDLSRTLEDIAAQMRQEGLRPVVVASGQDDRRHLFCRIANPDRRKRYRERAQAAHLDIRSGSRLIRPPLAPHRLGLPVSLLSPTDPDEVLAALSMPADVLDQPGPRALSPRMHHLLQTGDYAAYGYRSRSEMILALAVGFANASLTEDSFLEALLDPNNAAGEKVRERTNPKKYISGRWRKALARVASRPPITNRDQAQQGILRVRSVAERQMWVGRGGASEWAVLQSHVRIAIKAGKLVYQASVRDVGEDAGLTAQAVGRVQRRLRSKGWLRLVLGARDGAANVWTLRIPALAAPAGVQSRRHSNLPGGCEESVNAIAPAPGSDAFRWQGLGRIGLGKSAQRVWQVLGEEAQKPDELSTVLGIKRRMVQYHLARLAKVGLALREPAGWRRGLRDLARVAAEIGTIGTGDVQRLKHKRDRDVYREYQTARRIHSETTSLDLPSR